MTERRKILVTSALPYANGPIHLGHLVEYIQTDIWVRFQKLRGHECIYLCADDTHGTAIMMSAQRTGCTEEEWIAGISEEHQRDFAGFGVEFDNYGSTNSPENYELCKNSGRPFVTRDWSKKKLSLSYSMKKRAFFWRTGLLADLARSAARKNNTVTAVINAEQPTVPAKSSTLSARFQGLRLR